jgi:hypothetical protein
MLNGRRKATTQRSRSITKCARAAKFAYERKAPHQVLSGSFPPEQLCDFAVAELHPGGAAVIALARAGRDLHLAQKRVHLGDREDSPGADRAVAGEWFPANYLRPTDLYLYLDLGETKLTGVILCRQISLHRRA